MKKTKTLLLAALALLSGSSVMAQSEVTYASCGYDVNNQKMVNFRWTAEEGFQSADAPQGSNLSAVAYRKGNDLYTLSRDGQQLTLASMDAETFVQKGQVTTTLKGDYAMPKMAYYCDQRLMSYAITSDKEEGVGERYYIATIDEQTAEVKRLSTISYWYDNAQLTSVAPIAFYVSYGAAYVVYLKRQGGKEQFCEGQLNLASGIITETGAIIAIEGVDREKCVASFFYEPTTYRNYLAISPDGKQNTSIWYMPSFATNGIVECTKAAEANTVLASCYQRPSTVQGGMVSYPQIAAPSDFTIEADGAKLTISFTIPTKDVDGNELVLQDWATQDYSKTVNFYVYMDNSSVTVQKPEGVNNYFPGDKVEVTADLAGGAVYNLANPYGLHCFTLNLMPSNGYSNSAKRSSMFKLVGGAKPCPVTDAKAVKSGKNSATFSWTAPTATEYSDWGYEFDGTNLSYSIVRNSDGTVVAEGITGTTAEVDNLAKEPGDFDFSIYAYADGTQSAAACTNAVSCEPPTYQFMGYNNTTGTITAFNIDDAFTHTEWTKNSDIGNEVGFVRANKLYTTKYSYSKTQWSEYGSQTFCILTADKFERQGYAASNYWYANQGQIIRHLVTACYDGVQDRAFGAAVDTVRNSEGVPTALRYYAIDVDTVYSYQLQNRITNIVGQWPLDDDTKDGMAILAMTHFQGKTYAAVAMRLEGEMGYELAAYDPYKEEMELIADIDLPIDPTYGTQFFISTADKLYLGYNNGEDNTALYELDTEGKQLTKVCTMDGIYTYAYQRPSATEAAPALAAMTAPTATVAENHTVSLTATAPGTDANGQALEGNVEVTLLADGEPLPGAATTVAPGAAIELSGLALEKGLHLLTVVATANGKTARAAANVIVGGAKPNAPTNAAAEMFDLNECNITWTAPTTSIWADFGGKILETDVLTYIVALAQGDIDEPYVDDCPDQEFYVEHVADVDGNYSFYIYAVNDGLVSAPAETNTVTVGTPTAIGSTVASMVKAEAIYNQAGVRTDKMQRGLNIVRTTDGRTVKVIMK